MKNKLMDLGLLWLRVMLGLGIMSHGWSKITSADGVVAWAEGAGQSLGLPLPVVFGLLAVAGEVLGGFFVLLGLWTRYAAAAVCAVMLTAFFVVFQGDPFSKKELAAAYAVVAIAVIIIGPGRFAVDGGKGGGKAAPAKKGK